jgi:hypothetical protein
MNEKEGEEVEQVEDAENEEAEEGKEKVAKPGPIASRLIERKATKRKREPTGRTIGKVNAKRNARIRNK